MAKKLWCVRQRHYSDLSVEITVVPIDLLPLDLTKYDRFAFIAEKGMYCTAIKEGDLYDRYDDFFYNIEDADRYAKAIAEDIGVSPVVL